jgi:hypothetical protein
MGKVNTKTKGRYGDDFKISFGYEQSGIAELPKWDTTHNAWVVIADSD